MKYEPVFGDHEFANGTCEIAMKSQFGEIIEMALTVPIVIPEGWAMIAMRRIIKTPVQHSDDINVDAFAKDMKVKLEHSRNNGRSGWETCPIEFLVSELKRHVDKGDPVDVANFAMMIHQRGERISNPVWSKADQDAGKLPEVGWYVYSENDSKSAVVIAKDHEGDIWFQCSCGIVRCTDGYAMLPIETPEEKAARLREEWCIKALSSASILSGMQEYELKRLGGYIGDIYDALLSGELKMPEVQK